MGLDLSEVALDGSLHKAPCGGDRAGPNPTDRAEIGWKWSVASDRHGVPVGWAIDGANRNDIRLLEPTLAAVASLLLGSPSPAGAVAGYGDVADDRWFTETLQWSVDDDITGLGGACFGAV